MNKLLLFFSTFTFFLFGCQDEIPEKQADKLSAILLKNTFERLAFTSREDLHQVILSLDNNKINPVTRGIDFVSLLSEIPSFTRSIESEQLSYYEVLGYDSLIPNLNFARLLNPLGELQVNDTIYKINHNGTYFFAKESYDNFTDIYKKDSLGILVEENLYKLSEGIYRYKTFLDTATDEETVELENENDDEETTRSFVDIPNYYNLPRFNADRHTWLGGIRQGLFGNDKYYNVKFSNKRRVRGRLYAYHYVVYSEAGVTGMMQKKNWIGWSKTQADELRIGWKNIILVANVDDPSLKGIPKQAKPIVGSITQVEIPSIGKGNLLDLYIADVELKDVLDVVGEGIKMALNKGNSAIGSGRKPTIQAVTLATRSKIHLVIFDNMRREYGVKSMTGVFSSRFNLFVTFNLNKLPSSGVGWAKTLSKTLSQESFKLKSGEAIICGRLDNNWKGMRIVKEAN